MLKGIKLSTFLSTPEEWHALVIGLCEIICPWPPYYKCLSLAKLNELIHERHYYYFGRALGIFAWLGIAAAIKSIFT